MVFRTFADDMKKIVLIIIAAVALLASCNDYETYGDKKEKERNAISKFIADSAFTIISEEQFVKNGNKTDLSRREFVKLDKSGVYMQIVREGCGSVLEENKTVNVLCRFMEQNIKTGDVVVRNDVHASMSSLGSNIDVSQYLDKMSVLRNGTTITASFVSGMMYRYHGSASVPGGWLVPLNYVKIGRPENDGEETAKVRLIVPHSQGTADASSSVIPCYYELTYQRER